VQSERYAAARRVLAWLDARSTGGTEDGSEPVEISMRVETPTGRLPLLTADLRRLVGVVQGTDRGPVTTYEITWKTGHTERFAAHQVSWAGRTSGLFGESCGAPRVLFHAEIEGRWTLLLSALEDDIRTIRNVVTEEAVSGD